MSDDTDDFEMENIRFREINAELPAALGEAHHTLGLYAIAATTNVDREAVPSILHRGQVAISKAEGQ